MDRERIKGKGSRLDFLGKAKDGTKVNLEVQVNALPNMGERSLFYWSRLYYNDLTAGSDYTQLTRAVTINILDFHLLDCNEYHSCYGIYNKKNQHQLTEDLEIHFLELSKYKAKTAKEMTRLERWMAYFSHTTSEDEIEEIAKDEPAIKEALEMESLFTKDEVARYQYDQAEKMRRDHIAAMNHATAVGEARAKVEGGALMARSIAKNLLDAGVAIDIVQKTTQLSLDEIREIKEEKLN